MRIQFTLLAAAVLLPSMTVAQGYLEIWPNRTSFTSRGNNGKNAGEVLQGFHGSHWAGINDNGNGDRTKACQVKSLYVLTQDQDGITQETFHWVIRNGTDANGPQVGTAGEIAVLGPFMTPKRTTSGAVAWGLTSTAATPVNINCSGFNSIGLRLTPSPNWSTDGQSVHASNQTAAESHASQEDHAWQILASATAATNPSAKRSWRMRIITTSPSFQFANKTTTERHGMGGMFPDTAAATAQGLSATLRDSGNKSGFGVLFLSGARIANGIAALPGTSRIFAWPPQIILGGALDSNGVATLPIAAAIPTGLTGTIHGQALTFSSSAGNLKLTNSQSTTFK